MITFDPQSSVASQMAQGAVNPSLMKSEHWLHENRFDTRINHSLLRHAEQNINWGSEPISDEAREQLCLIATSYINNNGVAWSMQSGAGSSPSDFTYENLDIRDLVDLHRILNSYNGSEINGIIELNLFFIEFTLLGKMNGDYNDPAEKRILDAIKNRNDDSLRDLEALVKYNLMNKLCSYRAYAQLIQKPGTSNVFYDPSIRFCRLAYQKSSQVSLDEQIEWIKLNLFDRLPGHALIAHAETNFPWSKTSEIDGWVDVDMDHPPEERALSPAVKSAVVLAASSYLNHQGIPRAIDISLNNSQVNFDFSKLSAPDLVDFYRIITSYIAKNNNPEIFEMFVFFIERRLLDVAEKNPEVAGEILKKIGDCKDENLEKLANLFHSPEQIKKYDKIYKEFEYSLMKSSSFAGECTNTWYTYSLQLPLCRILSGTDQQYAHMTSEEKFEILKSLATLLPVKFGKYFSFLEEMEIGNREQLAKILFNQDPFSFASCIDQFKLNDDTLVKYAEDFLKRDKSKALALASEFHRFGFQDATVRESFAMRLIDIDQDTVCQHFSRFKLDENAKERVVTALAEKSPSICGHYFKNFAIQDQKVREKIADIIMSKSPYLYNNYFFNFEIPEKRR